MSRRIEANLHKSICKYIKSQYPKVIFNSDLSGQNTSKAQSGMNTVLRSSRAIPDIVIHQAEKRYYGLFLEVKKITPFKKDGTLKSQKVHNKKTGEVYDHLQEQQDMINKLKERGYYADFVWTFEMAKQIIDEYLKN